MVTLQKQMAAVTQELATVAAQLHCATVQVRSGRNGVGSGVIWQPHGLIITNAHVISGKKVQVELGDGRVFDAEVTAKEPYLDLAALMIDAADLPTAPIRNADTLRVGELVLAMGNPLGLVGALSTGIISSITPPNAPYNQRWLMADIRLAPGNSGGPLADALGRVVGINSMIVGGLALAVPSNTVERFLQGTESRPYLGVSVQPVLVPLAGQRVLGLLILEVAAQSPAEAAKLLTGDILIGIDGQLFKAPDDLVIALWQAVANKSLQLDVLRGGQRITCIVSNLGDSTSPGLAA